MIRFLVLALGVTLLGCGGQASKEKPKVVVAEKEKKEEKKLEAKKAEPKTRKVDLAEYGMRGEITLPVEVAIEREQRPNSSLFLHWGELDVRLDPRPQVDYAEIRKSILESDPRGTLLLDERNVLLFRFTNRPEYSLGVGGSLDTKFGSIYFQATGKAEDEGRLRQVVEWVKTYTYTDRMEARDQTIQSLKKVFDSREWKAKIDPDGVLELHLERPLNEKELSQLADCSGFVSIVLYYPWPSVLDQVRTLMKQTSLRRLELRSAVKATEWLTSLSGVKGVGALALNDVSVDASATKAIASIPGLKALSLNEVRISDEVIRELSSLVGLEELAIHNVPLVDAQLAFLKELTRLRELHLTGTRISDGCLQHLSNLTKLKMLNLTGNRLSGSGFAYLRGLNELEDLVLSETDVDDAALTRIRQPKLSSLVIGMTAVTDEGMKHLATMKSLSALNLPGTAVTDKGLSQLAAHPNLAVLNVAECRIRGSGLKSLETLKSLRLLDLSGNPLADDQLPSVEANLEWDSLHLKDTPLTNGALPKLALLKGEVIVEGTRIDQRAVEALPKRTATILGAKVVGPNPAPPPAAPKDLNALLPGQPEKLFEKLKRQPTLDENDPNRPIIGIDLSGTEVTDLDLAELREIATLKSLNLAKTNINGSGLSYLSGLTQLRELNLSKTRVTAPAFVYLKPMRQLEKLELPDTPATEQELQPLVGMPNLTVAPRPVSIDEEVWFTVAKTWPNLSTISVSSNQHLEEVAKNGNLRDVRVEGRISNAGLFFLKPLKELRHLTLDSPFLSDPGMINVNGLHELTKLHIPFAPIGDAGMNQIKGAFKLAELSIYEGYLLTDRAAADLRDLPSMAELTVRDTKFTDKGFEMLCELKDLEQLDLRGASKLTDAIWNHVKKLEELRELNLNGSQVSGKGIDAISELKRLRLLNVANTQFNDEALTYLRRLPGLMELSLVNTKVTRAAVMELRAARPNLKIFWEGDFEEPNEPSKK